MLKTNIYKKSALYAIRVYKVKGRTYQFHAEEFKITLYQI